MKENFNNKISRLELENFTCFAKADMAFSSGINVFIGENGTGKTHILKALYAMTRKHPNYDFLKSQMKELQKKGVETTMSISQNFIDVFKGDGDYSKEENGKFTCKLFFDKKDDLRFVFTKDHETKKTLNVLSPTLSEIIMPFNLKPLFIPSTEMLSWFKGFVAAYEQRESSFDATYYDLGKALSLLPLRMNNNNNHRMEVLEFMEETQITVTQINGEFYVHSGKQDKLVYNASRVASGINKLAEIIYLIHNGSITNKSVLFWDEPETNLNPKYIKIVAKFLQVLAKNGVQIFVATHDYLLTNLLSLSAEYPKHDTPPMRFFSLSKGENGTEIEFANTIHGVQNNAILDEFADYSELMLNSQIQKLQNV
jgi:predicted ATPase